MNFDEIRSILEARTKPALHLKASGAEQGFSKFGGAPDAPADYDWPHWKDGMLSFLAQIDLADISDHEVVSELPKSGRLYFFYDVESFTWGFDPADRGSWQVRYVPADVPVAAVTPPKDLAEEGLFEESRCGFHPIATYPSFDDLDIDQMAVPDDVWDAVDAYRRKDYAGAAYHQIGGWPDPVQNGGMEVQCQLAASGFYLGDSEPIEDPRIGPLLATADDWQLLLQIDTDEDIGMMWGDCGVLYFWIRGTNLARLDFSDVWMILQCS
jgi:uncharacterized protein YwqG